MQGKSLPNWSEPPTRKWRRLAAGLQLGVLLLSLLQCSSWRVQNVPPATLIAERHPDKVRITRPDSTKLTLQQPMVVGDSIVGKGGTVAVADATAVALLKFDALKTLGLLGGIVVGAGVLCAATDCMDFSLGNWNLGE